MFAKKKLCGEEKVERRRRKCNCQSSWILYVLTADTAFTYALDKLSKRERTEAKVQFAVIFNFSFPSLPAGEFQAFPLAALGSPERERTRQKKMKIVWNFPLLSWLHICVMAFRPEAMTLTENLHQPTRDRSYVACWSRSTLGSGWLAERRRVMTRVRWVGGRTICSLNVWPKATTGREKWAKSRWSISRKLPSSQPFSPMLHYWSGQGTIYGVDTVQKICYVERELFWGINTTHNRYACE